MSASNPRIQPGDVITASLIQGILDDLDLLKATVAGLQGSSSTDAKAVILTLLPSGSVRAGAELQVVGRNFGFSIGAHRVYLDGNRILAFKSGTSDEKLIFDVPRLNVPSAGRAATLTVGNQFSTDARTIVVLPADIPLSGDAVTTYETVSPATPVAGAEATFLYRLTPTTNRAGEFRLTAQVEGVPNVAEWEQQIELRDVNGAVLAASSVPTQAEVPVLFKVYFKAIPATPANATFTLKVNGMAPGVRAVGDARAFTVGQKAPDQDSSISLVAWIADPVGALDGGTLKLAETGQCLLTAFVQFTTAGRYDLTGTTAAAGWTGEVNGVTTSNPVEVTAAELTAGGGTASKTLEFLVTGGSAATGSMEFKIQRQGQTSFRTKSFVLGR